MIDHNDSVFSSISTALREQYETIYVIGTELTSTPPRFPAVSVVQNNNFLRTEFSTFNELENVVNEEYKVEVYSNLKTGKEAQCREITDFISDTFKELGYVRTFSQPMINADTTISRHISRYRKTNSI